jgi:hypothetical protein
MRIILCAAATLAMLSMTTASFAGGPTGGTGTPDSGVSTQPPPGSTDTTGDVNMNGSPGMSGSSGDVTYGSGNSSAESQNSGIEVLPPSGGKGGFPARQNNGCQTPGMRQDTGASTGLNC